MHWRGSWGATRRMLVGLGVGLGRVLINAQLRRSFEAIDVNAFRGSLRAQSHVCHAGLVYVGAISSNTSVIARILSMCLLDTLSDGRVSSRHVLGRGHRCECSDRKSNQKCKGKLVCVPHELSSIGVRRFHAVHHILVFSAEAMSGSKADIITLLSPIAIYEYTP